MKILHTADWHIGQFKGPVVDGVNLRSQDTVKCLEYMVEVAKKERPDVVCISGDIFHQEQIGPVRYSDEMIHATNIITALAHFAHYVIVMRGTPNHDGSGQFRVLERMLLNVSNVCVVTKPYKKTSQCDIGVTQPLHLGDVEKEIEIDKEKDNKYICPEVNSGQPQPKVEIEPVAENRTKVEIEPSCSKAELKVETEPAQADVFIKLPLINGDDFLVTKDYVKELKDLYPAVDVEQALRGMRGWLDSNPRNKKTPQKYEIARVIDKLKSVVQKNDQFPALGGILVKNGYLIASNSEITMKVKLEASEGNHFIIPMKAFDLIKNLPDGEVDISSTDQNVVLIKTRGIKNKYQSYPPEEFIFDITEDPEAEGVQLNGKKIMEAIGHVIYAAADTATNAQMTGIYFEGTENKVSLAALDGHVIAVDSVPAEGAADMKLIVPKATAKKLVSMGVIDDVTLTYTKNSAIFKSEEYVIYTRLIQGEYFKYQKMFSESEITTYASRTDLIGAMTRAKMCTEEKRPAIFKLENEALNISITDKLADYQEQVPLQEAVCKPIRLGFDSKLVLETLKAFTCDNVVLGFTSPKTPMIVEAEDSDMKAMVLPVAIREERS